jgi:hypothetical protein
VTGTTAARVRNQCGTALVEVSWLAMLLLVPLLYILLAAFDIQRASYGVSAATRAAGRAFVLAPDVPTGQARAVQAAAVALQDQGLTLDPAALAVTCEPAPDACLQPGSAARVALSVSVPLPLLPDALGGVASIRVSSTHLAPYGTFRESR